mgnify:CR=1 FL=1|jgi:hypothetical protein
MKNTVKKLLLFGVILFQSSNLFSTSYKNYSPLWHSLDSITNQTGVERHFAAVYVWATKAADDYIATLPDTPKILMTKLQLNFAELFKKGISDAKVGENNDIWSVYFKEKNLTPVQYKLLGTNDHINGDSWKVLTSSFTRDELDIVAPYYHHCTLELFSVIDSLHFHVIKNSKRMKTLHFISLGTDKLIARRMLTKWRAKQFNLALNYFDNVKMFETEHKKIEAYRKRMQKNIIQLVR